jgi:hypothetical protein
LTVFFLSMIFQPWSEGSLITKGLGDQTPWLFNRWVWSSHRSLWITLSSGSCVRAERRWWWISWSVFNYFPIKIISCRASDYLRRKVKKTGLNLIVKILRISAARPMRSSSIPLWLNAFLVSGATSCMTPWLCSYFKHQNYSFSNHALQRSMTMGMKILNSVNL